MRHWKFIDTNKINEQIIATYIKEAIENQQNGNCIKNQQKKSNLYSSKQRTTKKQNTYN